MSSGGWTRPSDVIAGGITALPEKFYHPRSSRNALGLVGGNEVTVVSGNLVDAESDLLGITRDLTHATQFKYRPSCALGADSCPPWPKPLLFVERSNGRVVWVSTAPRHLPTSQYVSFPGVPAPTPFVQEVYGSPWRF